MSKSVSPEIRVSVAVGCHQHSGAIGLSGGELVEGLEIDHSPEGFRPFFDRIARREAKHDLPASLVMQGCNGHAHPPDRMLRLTEYRQPVSKMEPGHLQLCHPHREGSPGCSQGQGHSTQSCQEGGRRQVSL